MRSPGAVPRMMKIAWRTFSSSWLVETPPFKLSDTGNRSPLPRKSRSFGIGGGLRLEATLDELLALGARDAGRAIDFFDRQRTMVAERATDLARPSSRD